MESATSGESRSRSRRLGSGRMGRSGNSDDTVSADMLGSLSWSEFDIDNLLVSFHASQNVAGAMKRGNMAASRYEAATSKVGVPSLPSGTATDSCCRCCEG